TRIAIFWSKNKPDYPEEYDSQHDGSDYRSNDINSSDSDLCRSFFKLFSLRYSSATCKLGRNGKRCTRCYFIRELVDIIFPSLFYFVYDVCFYRIMGRTAGCAGSEIKEVGGNLEKMLDG